MSIRPVGLVMYILCLNFTGPKVISKKISVKSVIEVTKVLKRPPVIWDNIHANDYDPKRVFLGPYAGRSPELIPYIRGVLTNPNCEFEANFVALHTLSQWSRSNVDGLKKDLPLGKLFLAHLWGAHGHTTGIIRHLSCVIWFTTSTRNN